MSSNEKWCYILKDKRLKLAKWTCREEVLLQDGFPGKLTSRWSWACNFIKDCLAMNIWEWRRKQNQPRKNWCCKASPTSGSRARMILQSDWGLGWYTPTWISHWMWAALESGATLDPSGQSSKRLTFGDHLLVAFPELGQHALPWRGTWHIIVSAMLPQGDCKKTMLKETPGSCDQHPHSFSKVCC